MRKTLAVAVAAVVLALCGCSGGITSGTITGKHHAAAYTYSTVLCVPSGKSTVCIPQIYTEPERWTLNLRNGDQIGNVDVDENAYDSVKVGDTWNGR